MLCFRVQKPLTMPTLRYFVNFKFRSLFSICFASWTFLFYCIVFVSCYRIFKILWIAILSWLLFCWLQSNSRLYTAQLMQRGILLYVVFYKCSITNTVSIHIIFWINWHCFRCWALWDFTPENSWNRSFVLYVVRVF